MTSHPRSRLNVKQLHMVLNDAPDTKTLPEGTTLSRKVSDHCDFFTNSTPSLTRSLFNNLEYMSANIMAGIAKYGP